MTTLTVRMPEDKHERLKELARSRRMSVNKLIDELATVALANHDALLRFRALADTGDPRRALDILERLDALPAEADLTGSG
jgi:predicted DNA-binding ribbon-helix-helix protein